MTTKPTGLTKDAGWQIGVTRTLPTDLDIAWDYLLSPAGLSLWLGDGVPGPLEKGLTYETTDGTIGEIRSVRPGDRVRLTWRPPGRQQHAIVQLALRPSATGCSVRFHSERLDSENERKAMRSHWRKILDQLAVAIPPEDPRAPDAKAAGPTRPSRGTLTGTDC